MKRILPLLIMFVLSSCASEYYHRSADGVYYADGNYYNDNRDYDSFYGYPSYYSEYGYSGNNDIFYRSYYPDRWGVTYNGGRYGPYRSSFIQLGFGFSSCHHWSWDCNYSFGTWHSGYRSPYYWSLSPWYYNDWWWYNHNYYRHHRHQVHHDNRRKPNDHRSRPDHEIISLRKQPAQRPVRQPTIDRQEPRLRRQDNRRVNTRGAIPTQQRYNRLQNRPNLTIRDINTPHSTRYNKPLRQRSDSINHNQLREQRYNKPLRQNSGAINRNQLRVQQYNKPLRQNSGSVNRSQPRVQQYNKPLRQSIPNRPVRVQQYHKPARPNIPVRNTRSNSKPSVSRRSGSVSSRPTPPKKSQRSSYSKIR